MNEGSEMGADEGFGHESAQLDPARGVGEDDPRAVLRALGSVLGHELRTPLTTIYAGAGLVVAPGLPDATKAEAARSIMQQAEHLHRTIEDLVVLVRWELDPPPIPEPLLVRHILEELVARSAGVDGRPPIDLRIERQLPPIMGSRSDVEHVVRNLIAHAAANAPPGGRVAVEAHLEGPALAISVRDDGRSFDSEDADHAFDLFARTSRAAGDPSGANIGLVVARRLVERMGGRIRVVPQAEAGEIVVDLPAVT